MGEINGRGGNRLGGVGYNYGLWWILSGWIYSVVWCGLSGD